MCQYRLHSKCHHDKPTTRSQRALRLYIWYFFPNFVTRFGDLFVTYTYLKRFSHLVFCEHSVGTQHESPTLRYCALGRESKNNIKFMPQPNSQPRSTCCILNVLQTHVSFLLSRKTVFSQNKSGKHCIGLQETEISRYGWIFLSFRC